MKRILHLFLYFPLITRAQDKINMTTPPALPAVFAEGIISTELRERDFALSPDGTELFYTLQTQQGLFQAIVYRKKDKQGNWSKPELAPFAGQYSDLEPAFTADGKKLFFASNRPLTGTGKKDFDIWYAEKVNGVWTGPKNVGSPVNTAGDEFYPSIAASGNLYYTGEYKNGIGKEDIFMAVWKDGTYASPVVLDTAVNSATYEFNAFVSPDEQYIIFTSYGRKDDKGRGDLYMSVKDDYGKWQPAKNLAFLNSDKLDYCPFTSFDKKLFFFTSERNQLRATYEDKPVSYKELINLLSGTQNGNGSIYWVSFEEVLRRFRQSR